MDLLFLGVSAAFAVGDDAFHSNMLLKSDSDCTLLIDCGSDARRSLHAQGYSYKDIDAVYISHLHADHVGGLEWLGFSKLFLDGQRTPLYISTDQRETLWNNVLSGGMSSLEEETATLSTFFDVQPLSLGSFTWENYAFELIKTEHSISNGKFLPSYGLLIESPLKKKTFISTDTRFNAEYLEPVYAKADLIFHDCEILPNSTMQHARYEELISLPDRIKQKMWLYDYNNTALPNAKKDGFLGFVRVGQSFSI